MRPVCRFLKKEAVNFPKKSGQNFAFFSEDWLPR